MTDYPGSLIKLFVSPENKTQLDWQTDRVVCQSTGKTFPIIEGVPSFLIGRETDSLNEFWDSGWASRLEKDHEHLRLDPADYRTAVEERLRASNHLGTPITDAKPKTNETVLNIGCGLNEASGFIGLGATSYIGIDYSLTAAINSNKAIKKLGGNGVIAQANAESLPIDRSVIDLVYSSGVIHHTPNIEEAVSEIHRVLKGDARAVIGLYNKYSPKFIMARLIGGVKSFFSPKINGWYEDTETAWETNVTTKPYTKVFSKTEILRLFNKSKFDLIQARKTGFNWGDSVPIIGKYFQRTSLGKSSAKLLSPILGSMWVLTFLCKK